MEKLGSPAEAQAQNDLEIVSIGALYRGHWEKKYWSSSRAKDRYPYPVGYRAVRDHAGTRCQMEIREGPKGPLFLVKLVDEESCSGLTPDLAWKSFQKKNSPKAINWNGRRLSSNIDGSELFGFRNKVVQRLLRELVADANSASPNETKQALQLHENVQNQYRSSDSKLLVYFRKSKRNGKRSVKCKPEERITKRMHKEGCMSNDIEKSDLLGGSQKEESNEEEMDTMNGDYDAIVDKHLISMENHNKTVAEAMPSYAENIEGSIIVMNNNPNGDFVQDSFIETDNDLALKPAPLLLDEISLLVNCTPEDATMKEELTNSMPDVRLSSGSSNLSSQMTDQDSEQQDITRSMMAFLLPQAIPLLKKTYRKKSSRRKMRGNIVRNDLSTKENFGGQVEAGDINHKSDAKSISSTLLEVEQSTGLSLSECNLGSLNAAKERDVIPDTCEGYNAVNKTDCKRNDASGPCLIMKDDDKLNCELDGEAVVHTLVDLENINLPLSECEHEPHLTSEDAKDVILDILDENIIAKDAGHVSGVSGPSSIKNAVDKSQKDLEKSGILLSDSFLAGLEEEFVKIETGRIQNFIKTENPLSESITCQNFENISIPENEVTGLPLENKLKILCGPYLHPQPVLSVTLNSKGDCLELWVLCGALDSCERTLYVYHVTSEAQPSFVGYTSLCFLSSEEPPVKGNLALGRVGLQYITEERLLVLFPSIKAPFCSNMSIDCACLNCKLEHGDENWLRIVHVNFGFVSLVTKLMSQERATCILVCKPNYIIVFEESARLHVWVMSPKWSGVSDEFTVPSSEFMGPSILELKEVPGSNCLVLGHNGFGVFCLWDIKGRTHLSMFLAPNNIILEILPLSCFNAHKSEVSSSNYLQAHLKDVVTSKQHWESQDGDMAVWLLVSSATVSEFQKDLKAREPNRRWKLALLAKNSLFLTPVLDQRINVLDVSTHYGFAGTLHGIFYKWEIVSGRKVASIHCSESGSVSCIAVDHQSSTVAVADDRNQVLIYML